jgi:hypothetical protein
MENVCRLCGTMLPGSARFCSKCGTPISVEQQSPVSPVHPNAVNLHNTQKSNQSFSIGSRLGEARKQVDLNYINPQSSLINSVVKIAVSLAFGVFVVWVVNVGWVLEILAGVILLGCVVLGIFTGRWVYKALSDSNPNWMRLTVAIIIGVSIALAVGELTHSHNLIRYYDHYSSDNDE